MHVQIPHWSLAHKHKHKHTVRYRAPAHMHTYNHTYIRMHAWISLWSLEKTGAHRARALLHF